MSCAAVALLLIAQDPGLLESGVYARVQAWSPRLAGDVTGDDDDTDLALDDDLDLDSPGWTGVFEVGYRNPAGGKEASGFSISGMSFSTSGSETLSSAEVFAKHPFPAGTAMRSRFRFTEVGLDLVVTGLDTPGETHSWRFSLGMHYLEAEIEMESAAGSESEDYVDLNLRWGFGGEWRPLPWAFAGGVIALYTDGITLVGNADPVHVAGEFQIHGGVQWGPVRLEGGYRVFAWTLGLPWEEETIDLFLHGPSVAATLRF
jgi:hypothetical protein